VGGLLVDAFQESWRYNAILGVMYFQAGPRRYFQTVQHMMNDDPFALANQVTHPTLVIRGGRDAIVSDPIARKLAAALPKGVYTPLDSAAHAIEYNNPREFTDSTITFLTRAEEKLGLNDDATCVTPAHEPVVVAV
jgi:pimeloyl-ACP methyl ester carboxylesterase